MSRLSQAEHHHHHHPHQHHHHHHHHNHAEGDGLSAHHSREAFQECGAREIRDNSLRLSCQRKAVRAATNRKDHGVVCDHTMDQIQQELGQGRFRDDLMNPGTRNRGGNNDDSECLSPSLVSRPRETKGDGFTSSLRRVANTGDQMAMEYRDKTIKAYAASYDCPKRSRKESQSLEAGAVTSPRKERDSKSSSKWRLDGSDGRTSSKGYTYIHLQHNEIEEIESAVRRQRDGKSRSNQGAGSLASAHEDKDFGGLSIKGNEPRTYREECAPSERSSATSRQESNDMNVLIKALPDTGPGNSRLRFYCHDAEKVSRADKTSAASNSCPSDTSVSEFQLMSQAEDHPVTAHVRKYPKMDVAGSKMAKDVQVNTRDTSHSSHARTNQAEHSLYSDAKHRPELNVSEEKIENSVETAANPSQEALPTNESRLTDHSQFSDATLPTVAAVAPRKVQQLHVGGGEEPPKSVLINHSLQSPETESAELRAAPSGGDLKVEPKEYQDRMQQSSHGNDKRWTLDYEWLSSEYISQPKPMETVSHKEHNSCADIQAHGIDEHATVTGMTRWLPTKSPRRPRNYEAKETVDCVSQRPAKEIPVDGQSSLEESVQFEESDTETLDSKSRRLLNQLQMVQICKRRASVLLKQVQSIIDGSHPLKGNTKGNKSKGQRPFSKSPEEIGEEPATGTTKWERKPRPMSKSPEQLRQMPSSERPVDKAGENYVAADASYSLPIATLAGDTESSSPYIGLMTKETSMEPRPDCTKRSNEAIEDNKTVRTLGRSEITPDNHKEELYEYYIRKSPNTFVSETNHPTAFDSHIIQQRKPPIRGEKYSEPVNEPEQKSDQRGYGSNKPAGMENCQAREVYSLREPLDRKQFTSKYTQWMSGTDLHEAISPTNYYENISNTSESVDSFFLYDDVGSAKHHNGREFFAKDDKYYHLIRKRGTNSFTRSRSANPHTCKRQNDPHYQQKTSTKGKRHEISRSSMRQSLKEAIKSAKQSISAAAKVAEALSFVVKASTDSSTSLSSEAAIKLPVCKQGHHSKSPGLKGNPEDNIQQTETADNVVLPFFNGTAAWPVEEEKLYTRPFQENMEQGPYRCEKDKRLSSLQQRQNAATNETKSSASTYIRDGATELYQRHFSSGQNLRGTETNPSGTSHAMSVGQATYIDSSPLTFDGTSGVTKYFTFEGTRINDGPAALPIVEDTPAPSPKIRVQITISKSPELIPRSNINFLAAESIHRKDKPAPETGHKSSQKRLSSQKPMSEYEQQSSELTLSKENWAASHSCCCSTRKTCNYFNEVNPVENRLSRNYASSNRRDYRQYTMNGYVDGSANNVISDSVKDNANENRSPVSKSPADDLTQRSEQIKTSDKRQELSLEDHLLSPNKNRRTANKHRDSCSQKCRSSQLVLSHHHNCPLSSHYSPSKKPKHSKANLCLNRSFKISHRTTSRGKRISRPKSLSDEFYKKVNKTEEYKDLHDAKNKSLEIGIPVCFSDPSSPCVLNHEFQSISSSYAGKLKTVRETCSCISPGKSRRRCSSINRQYSLQEISPRRTFFPHRYQSELPAGTKHRQSYIEYESEHSQTTLYVEMKPPLLVHSSRIKAADIPKSDFFPMSGVNASSIEFTAICDKIILEGDGEGTCTSWNNWPQCQTNNFGNSKNMNNNNNIVYVGNVDADDKMADHLSDIGECHVIDHATTKKKMAARSKLSREPEAILPVRILFRQDCDGQRRPVLTALENLAFGRMNILIAQRNVPGYGRSAGLTDNSSLPSGLKNSLHLRRFCLKSDSLIINCRKIKKCKILAIKPTLVRPHLLPMRFHYVCFRLGRHGRLNRL